MDVTRRRLMKGMLATLAAPTALRWGQADAATSTPLSMQASWVNDAEFIGYFVAMDQGLYKQGGVALKYLPGGPDVIPESSLLSGKADLALTTPDTTTKAIAKDGAPFKIIGTQFQKNPIGIVSLAKSNITKPSDLIGKTLAVPPVNTLSVLAMFRMNGINPQQVKIVPYAYDPTPLIKGEVDATVDFVTDVPFTIEQAGVKPAWFLLYDYGYTIFNDTVVVMEKTLQEKRQALVSWLRASRQGWEENLKNPKAYPTKFEKTWFKGNGRTLANEIFSNTTEKPLIESPRGIFAMTHEDIQKNIEALAAVGIKAKKEYFDTSLLAEI